VAPDGARRRIIGSDGDGVAQACPQFSADGRFLAYGEGTDSGPVTTHRGNWPVAGRAVVVVEIDDHGNPPSPTLRVPVAPSLAGDLPCPMWSRDGRRFAFVEGMRLWIVDAATGIADTFYVGIAPAA